jgi:hypothetical protein
MSYVNPGTGTKIFNNIDATITNKVALGFQYLGIENCKLKFQNFVENRVTIERLLLLLLAATCESSCLCFF